MEKEKIIVKIPSPPITSLIFEGGGVKGIAYAGAYKALKEQAGLLDRLHWVAGSSAGAMTALLVALNFTPEEIESELTEVNFSKFAQSPPEGKLAIIHYIRANIKKISSNINHGINDGRELYKWVQNMVEKKLGVKEATFLDLKKKSNSEKLDVSIQETFKYKNLFVIVTNAHKNKTEIFSWETTPNLQIADAVLASMSIPGFFYIRYIDSEKYKIDWNPTQEKIDTHKIIPYVDGGVLNNYPIDIFRGHKYWVQEYHALVKSHNFNPSSLGIRVDTKEEVRDLIDTRYHEHEIAKDQDEKKPVMEGRAFSDWFVNPTNIISMANKFITLLTSDLNKVEQYCQMTIAINDCGIQTTQFDLTQGDKNRLKESGRESVNAFFNEFFKKGPFKEISYNNRSELEEDVKAKKELIKQLSNLKYPSTYEHEILRLKLENKLSEEVLLSLKKKIPSKFFEDSRETSTSGARQKIMSAKRSREVQEFEEKIEEISSDKTSSLQPEVSHRSDKVVIPLKFGDENDGDQESSFRKFCCW